MKKFLVIGSLLIFVASFVSCNNPASDLNRYPAYIHYSKHARCRMECRHIDESEVKEILNNGNINFSKSDLNEDVCHKRYALEGTSHDDQRIRIIVAECNDDLTVITVIDLGRDWSCNCE
jgi:hypothetical protein